MDTDRNPVCSSFVHWCTTKTISNQLNIVEFSGRSTLTVKNHQDNTIVRNVEMTDLENVKVCKEQITIASLFTNDTLLWITVGNKQSYCRE